MNEFPAEVPAPERNVSDPQRSGGATFSKPRSKIAEALGGRRCRVLSRRETVAQGGIDGTSVVRRDDGEALARHLTAEQ